MHSKLDATAATWANPSEFASNISIQLGCCGCCNFSSAFKIIFGLQQFSRKTEMEPKDASLEKETNHLHTIYFVGSYSIPYFLRMYSVLFLGVHRGMSRSVFPKPYWLKHPAVRTRIAPQSPSLKWPLGRDAIRPEIQKLCSIIYSIYIYITYIYM